MQSAGRGPEPTQHLCLSSSSPLRRALLERSGKSKQMLSDIVSKAFRCLKVSECSCQAPSARLSVRQKAGTCLHNEPGIRQLVWGPKTLCLAKQLLWLAAILSMALLTASLCEQSICPSPAQPCPTLPQPSTALPYFSPLQQRSLAADIFHALSCSKLLELQ